MDAREQRGLEIAASVKLQRKRGVWMVPSQAGKGTVYTVDLKGDVPTCSCPDHETRGVKCKHIFAAAYVLTREQNTDGSTTVTERVMLTAVKRTTYPQNWPAYNAAQTNEKDKFQSLLHDLCRGVSQPPARNGRPPLPLADAIFSATFKVYSTVSGRRFMSDLREAKERGFISKVPHYNSIFNYLENSDLTHILRSLITESSLPLKSVEQDFAVDSSGFTTSRFIRWFDHKYGTVRQQHEWVKCHLMCGVKTNIVTAVEIHDRNASDTKLLPPMLDSTARNFRVSELSADKGYASIKNTDAVAAVGATPYIAFKSIHTGTGGGLWGQMYHYFMFRRDEFLQHYHKRSNVESTFSMMKRKFGDSLRSKNGTAQVNETLCKVLCHNLVVLIHEMHELGINPVFWAESQDAQKPAI
jgi:transposase